ncbi:hypothetical protein Mapa_010030 [Marchantia paleacea]|nr:hypothetical protein Mapa_010030 [Marchantia paleacea]
MAVPMKPTVVIAFMAVAFAALAGLAMAQTTGKSEEYTVLQSSANAPERARCIGAGKCYLKLLSCSNECPRRSTLGAGRRACFIDCARCEATCKHRKPNCYGFGSICYDPRLVGGDGSMFYFHGASNQDFCLVTDRNLHINGHFIGLRPEGRSRDYTWIQSLGLLFGSHSFSVGAKKVSVWNDNVDQLIFSYDGVAFSVEEEVGAIWRSNSGDVKVERTYETNVVEITVDRMLTMLVAVVPITEKENLAHNYQLPSDDVFAHLNLQFKFHNLSANVNGVLGQTYQPNYQSPAKVGVKMPVLGGEDRFVASGLLNADCKANQFSPESLGPVDILQPFTAECSSNDQSGSGIVCRR